MASHVFTLATPTPGQWNHVVVPSDMVALLFKNDSVLDFLLVFGGSVAPSFTTSPGGQANAFVNALEYPVIFVQKPGASSYEQALNAVGGFDGNLWYMAQDNTGGLALVGTYSSRTVLTIITYGPLDPVPPSGQAVSRQADRTNQTRDVAIPMTPFASYYWTPSTTVGNLYQPFPATVAILNPSTDTGMVLYVYAVYMSPQTTAGQGVFALQLVVHDYTNPGIILQQIDILAWRVGLAAGNNGDTFNYYPSTPFSVQFFRGGNLNANAGICEVGIWAYASPAAWPTIVHVQMDSDKMSPGQVRVPGIGQGLNPSQYAAGVPKF